MTDAAVPPVLTSAPKAKGWRRLAFGLAVVGGLLAVWSNPPAGQFYYPRCQFYALTGLQCPGCGATRALHAILHGRWAAAWHYNALAVSAIPVAAALGIRRVIDPKARIPAGWWFGLIGVAAAFGVGRNL